MPDAIAGEATHAIAYSSILAYLNHLPACCFVRSQPKDHGLNRQIEGADVVNRQLILIEGVVTTGHPNQLFYG